MNLGYPTSFVICGGFPSRGADGYDLKEPGEGEKKRS